MFYLRFVKDSNSLSEDFWLTNINSQSIVSWRGFAFENVCFNHINEIKKALGISGVITNQSAFTKRDEVDAGTQVDLIIERNAIIQEYIPKKSAIHNTLITTYGLKKNEYYWDFTNVLTIEDLFE